MTLLIPTLEPQLQLHHWPMQLFHQQEQLEDEPLAFRLWYNNHLLQACVMDLSKRDKLKLYQYQEHFFLKRFGVSYHVAKKAACTLYIER